MTNRTNPAISTEISTSDGNVFEHELSRGEQAAVACFEPKLRGAGDDLSDLGVGAGPGFSGVRDALLDQPVIDPLAIACRFITISLAPLQVFLARL
jgi:hypothetical protein